MSGKQKKMLIRIIATAVVFIGLFVVEHFVGFDFLPYKWMEILVFVVPYLLISYDIILKALRNICHGQIFDENFLMMIATFGAFAIGEYLEAVAVMLFYQTGELFQNYAVGKSRRSIADMMDICPEYANVEVDGDLVETDPDDVEVDSIIVIKPGERVPLDGIVIDGESMLDTSALTGESVPRRIKSGEEIISGCINGSGTLKVKVTKAYEDSTVARILELVENASSRKAKVENFITRFAKYYTPFVTIGAVLLAVIPSVITGNVGEWVRRACIFLVVSCPCALVISVPLGFFGGIGAASQIGVLVKGSNFLEVLGNVKTVVFDKTGTLTKGEFKVTSVIAGKMSEQEVLRYGAIAESYSTHPIAESVKLAYEEKNSLPAITKSEEISGHGVIVVADGQKILAGNAKLLRKENVEIKEYTGAGTVVYVAVDSVYAGAIIISDTIKDGVDVAIEGMKKSGIENIVMLTGDRKEVAEQVAKEILVDKVYSELLPGDKVSVLEEIISSQNGKIAFVGDGINDAPVLTRADVGIAMGSMGSDAAIEAADIVLMDDDVRKINSAVQISKKTVRIVRQNIVFALGVKGLVLLLGAFGIAGMWSAVFADVGVSVIAILNSMRIIKMVR